MKNFSALQQLAWNIQKQKQRESQSDFQNIIVEIAETVRHSLNQFNLVATAFDKMRLVRPAGVEPAASSFAGKRSIH